MANKSQKLIKNSLILLIGSILSKGINFLMAPLFTRWLTKEEYGTFDLLATYSMLLIPLFALGIHHAMFRYLLDANKKEEKESIISNSIFINILGLIFFVLAAVAFAYLMPGKENNILLLVVLCVTQTMQNYVGMYLRGIKKLSLYTITNVITTFMIMIFVTLLVKVLKLQLIGMVLGYAIAYVLSSTIGVIRSKNFFGIRLKRISYSFQREMIKYSIPLIPNSVAWWILNISDRIVISSFLGTAENAVLAVANKLPNLCISLFDVFQTAWIENITEAIKEDDWTDYLNNIINKMASFLILISAMIVTTNFFVFSILFEQEYRYGIKLVPILAVAVVFSSLGQFLGSVFIAEYNSVSQCKTIVISGVINICIDLALVTSVGLYAAVISTLVAYICLFLFRFIEIRRKYAIKINKRTMISFGILIISVVLSYFEFIALGICTFFVVMFILFVINKDILTMILNRIIKVRRIRS